MKKISASPARADVNGFTVKVRVSDPDREGRPLAAGCVLRGSVSLVAPPLPTGGPPSAEWHVRHLRVQLEGVEQHHLIKSKLRPSSRTSSSGSGDGEVATPTVHLWRTVTLVGVPSSEEEREADAQSARERQFAQANTRSGPLAGVVLSVHGEAHDAARMLADRMAFEERGSRRALQVLPGETVSVPFAVKLPPWLPPSLYYHIDAAQGSIHYTATAILDADLVPSPSSSGAVMSDEAPRETDGLPWRHGEWQSNATSFILRSAVSRRQLLQCHERTLIKSWSFFRQTWRFRVRSKNIITQALHAGKVTVGAVEVTVRYVSSTALLLTDPDDATSVAMKDRWTTALAGPAGGQATSNSPAAMAEGDGATALGTVISGSVGARALFSASGRRSSSAQSAPAARAPVGELRLRVRVQNGSQLDPPKALQHMSSVSSVRVELLEQIVLHRSPPETRAGRLSQLDDSNIVYTSEPIRLGYQDCLQIIRPGMSQSFDVVIVLPPRFRRSRAITRWKGKSTTRRGADSGSSSSTSSDGDEPAGTATSPVYSYGSAKHPHPAPSITTNHFTSFTYLNVTLPGAQVIPEVEPDTRNILVLAEAVDETDTTPDLPMIVPSFSGGTPTHRS